MFQGAHGYSADDDTAALEAEAAAEAAALAEYPTSIDLAGLAAERGRPFGLGDGGHRRREHRRGGGRGQDEAMRGKGGGEAADDEGSDTDSNGSFDEAELAEEAACLAMG